MVNAPKMRVKQSFIQCGCSIGKLKCTPHILVTDSPLLHQVYTWDPVRPHSHLINSIGIGSRLGHV